MELKISENEYWWGGCVNLGHEMPFNAKTNISFDLRGDFEYDDQFAPLLLSNKGRYIWSDKCFKGRVANGIIENGLPTGVLMIDGGWMEDYGIYEYFNQRKVPDPEFLISELHKMGFKVMVWVSPIAAPAGKRYKYLRDKGYLVKNSNGDTAIRKWWSGYSAVLDFSNPEAVRWMHSILQQLTDKYGIDGFKFDAGDCYFYEDDDITYQPISAREQTRAFNEMGAVYEFNEFRAAWNFGGKGIFARQNDKAHSWNSHGLNTLIPHTIAQGLMGYAYNCPDMVGGVGIGLGKNVDEELFVRWSQANALLGMMQMSALPWKILNNENSEIVIDAFKLHAEYGEKMYALAKNASKTGEPVIRHMCYEFPDEGFETVNDQFMVGSDLLAAPVVEKGCTTRKIKLPKGKWAYCDGTVFEGGQTISLPVSIKILPYFKKIN